MAKRENKGALAQILTALAIALLAGGSAPWWWSPLVGLFKSSSKPVPARPGPDRPAPSPPDRTTGGTEPTPSPTVRRCRDPWSWDVDFESCVRRVTVLSKVFSVGPLTKPVQKVAGRIDFYVNTERLPGTDSQGRAMYRAKRGVVQAVLAVLLGKRMVGDERGILYSTDEGRSAEWRPSPRRRVG